jgi:peroxiredoxin
VTTRPVGPPAQPFTTTTIKQKKISFPGDYKGKLVLVTFWATWCPYCREEVQTLRMAYARYHRKGLEILGISGDASRQRSEAQVAQFVQKNGLVWEQVYDGVDRIESLYKVTGFPTSFLVDGSSGRIVALRQALRGPQLLKTLERFLGPPGTPTSTTRPAGPPARNPR